MSLNQPSNAKKPKWMEAGMNQAYSALYKPSPKSVSFSPIVPTPPVHPKPNPKPKLLTPRPIAPMRPIIEPKKETQDDPKSSSDSSDSDDSNDSEQDGPAVCFVPGPKGGWVECGPIGPGGLADDASILAFLQAQDAMEAAEKE